MLTSWIKTSILRISFGLLPTKHDFWSFPEGVKDVMGYGLFLAQQGKEPPATKALKGFGGRKILELIEDQDGNTYRAVYTVRYQDTIYVLHAFQKKSKKGIATPKQEIDLIKKRLRDAESIHHIRTAKGISP